MSRARLQHILWLTTAIALQLLPCSSPAQEPASHTPSSASPADVARISPLTAKSRIAFFRELLEMSPAERDKAMAPFPPAKRQGLEGKIKEYESLTVEDRELRLLVTELQDYLLPLMNLPAADRPGQLALVPTNIAPMVAVRLEHWDRLTLQERKEVLENKKLLQQLTEFNSINPLQQNQVLTNMAPAQRKELQESLARWQALGKERREEITARFEEYFELTQAEKQRTLRSVSPSERAQIEKTVREYYNLNPRSRARVRAGLEKFCQLSPAEFNDFLRNAERWQALSPSERKAWRDLVMGASLKALYPPGAKPPRMSPPTPGEPGATERIATNR